MPRTNRSARQAGTRFERQTADHLKNELQNPYIDRQIKTGTKDKGDISNIQIRGHAIAVECKNTTRTQLAAWQKEAENEKTNLGAIASLIIHKRHGNNQPQKQWVTMTLQDLTTILNTANHTTDQA